MDRIEDKIQEIKKKEQRNSILYIAFILLIAAIMAYIFMSEKRNKKNVNTIDALEIKQTETYKELDSIKINIESLYNELKSSMRPEEYWKHTQSENSVEAYISYITTDYGIDKEKFLLGALKKLKEPATGNPEFKGWLWVGSKSNNGHYRSNDIVEIIYRYNGASGIQDAEIKVGDIIQLKTTKNRSTYRDKTLSRKNNEGWRNKTKAFVSKVWKDPNSINYHVEIKYY